MEDNTKTKHWKSFISDSVNVFHVFWVGIAWWNLSLSKSTTDLNPEFSFFLTGCHTKVQDFSGSYDLLIASERIVWFLFSQRY